MINNISYISWITITINHSYFKTKKCNLEVVPILKTRQLISKSGLLLKQIDACTWLLLKPSGEQDQTRIEMFFEDVPDLQFDIKNHTSDFYYYTEMEKIKEGECWNWCYIGKSGIYGQLDIHITKELLKEKTEIKLDLKSKVKCWEFILIPKFNTNVKALKLVESKKRLSFNFVEEVLIPGETKAALRFLSDDTCELTESYDFNIDLWEIKSNGDYLLSSSIPYPKPQSISIFNPENTITSYYYF